MDAGYDTGVMRRYIPYLIVIFVGELDLRRGLAK